MGVLDYISGLLDWLPLWLLAPMLAVLLVAAHEGGVRLRRLVRRRTAVQGASKDDDEEHGRGVGAYVTAALGLMALLVGFAFGMSLDRFNHLRALVADEAWTISDDYRRLLEAPEPQRTQLAAALIRYLDTRQRMLVIEELDLAANETLSEAAGSRLWLDTLSVTRGATALELRRAVDATDVMLKAAFARRSALAARVPATVLNAMALYAVVATVLSGYAASPTRRYLGASTIQLVLLALAICLIIDLDRARTGTIKVDEAPLLHAAARIRQFEAQRRLAPPAPWLRSAPAATAPVSPPAAAGPPPD